MPTLSPADVDFDPEPAGAASREHFIKSAYSDILSGANLRFKYPPEEANNMLISSRNATQQPDPGRGATSDEYV